MGLFCVSLHFRTTDDSALSAALNRRGVTECRVLAPKGGWTSLYEERASQQDDTRIRELAGGLSQELRAAAIAFMVHDSDVACYWLFDNGRLVDEYCSCPDYFDDEAADDENSGPSGGNPGVLLRYCRTGISNDELAAILNEETVFAEQTIERLADALGIDRQRAIADYRDGPAGGGPGDNQGPDNGDDDDDEGRGPGDMLPHKGIAGRLAEMFGIKQQSVPADPQVSALVQAAADEDTDTMTRLLAEGVAVDAEAPVLLPAAGEMAALGKLFPGGQPKIAMAPLLAALIYKRSRAVRLLLDGGADPNRVHLLFGSPMHVATGAGDEKLLELLMERGGDPSGRDNRGQTPL